MRLMKIIVLLLTVISITTAQNNSKNKKSEKIMFKTLEDSISYSIGQNIGASLKDPAMNIKFDMVFKGLQDAIDGKSELTPEEQQVVMNKFNQKLMSARAAQTNAVKDKNKKIGEAFLANNKTKEGVATTASGLQYKVIKEGTGAQPTDTSKVTVHYKGTLIDGTVFDSSYDRGEPITFPLNGVIKGWTEGVQLMKVGSKFEFYIPSELAYGDTGAGQVIEPGAVLIFEVELLSFE
ncbi:MAG: FKBP-type peptidyl-prolyl cis-trans isomerase [Melioribacteraceae bacterium]|nr:FKBP-type peptidyl-prolyl cis-trans isomerase [Melioribacteraceae bacterium]